MFRFDGFGRPFGGYVKPIYQMEELKSQLFTMKMRCHEYEQRLQLVNLHGLDGDKLHRMNTNITEKLNATQESLDFKITENANLRELIDVCKERLPKLALENDDLKAECIEKEKLIARIPELEAQLEFRNQNLKSMTEEMTVTKQRLQEMNSSLQCMEIQNRMLESRLSSLQVLEAGREELESQLKETHGENQDLQVKLQESCTNFEKLKLKLEVKDRDSTILNAVEVEKITQQFENDAEVLRTENFNLKKELEMNSERLRNSEADCARYSMRVQNLSSRETDAKTELNEMRFKVQSAERQKDSEIEQVKRQFELERDSMYDKWNSKFSQEQTANLEVQVALNAEKKKIEGERRSEKQKYREHISASKLRISELEAELVKLKDKWKSSLSSKRSSSSKENSTTASNKLKKSAAPSRISKTTAVVSNNVFR